ncbi:MAG: ROK family protein [Planctomycetes bacterium]|nr:ROK family protein [Planctomycetota bacterium]
MTLYAGIDIGGTNVKVGLCDERGRIVARDSIPTEAARGPADCIARTAATIHRLRGRRPLKAAGAGVPGPLDADRRVLVTAPNLPGWSRVRFPLMLSRALGGTAACMENDANCAALGEYAAGAGRNAFCMVLYTLGTGVGGGIIFQGKLWTGANGAAAELGHVTLDPDGPPCGCGNRGCLEAYASATALVRRYASLSGRNDATAHTIFQQARTGDARARHAIDEAARMLGVAMASMLHTLNPDVVVLSGGMAAGHGLLAAVRAEVKRRVFPMYLKGLTIARGTLGDDAGWIGAAMVARSRFKS